MDNQIEFKELVLAVNAVYPKSIFGRVRFNSGTTGDQFIKDELTIQLQASVLEYSNPKQIVQRTFPAPSFLDWLLRRKKTVEIEVDCKEIFVDPPIFEDNIHFYSIKIKTPE